VTLLFISPAGLPDPTAALPPLPLPRLPAADQREQRALELGGAITALRRHGLAWVAIARAVDLPLAEVRALARGYARAVAAELVCDALPAAETAAPSLIEVPAADARLHDRRPSGLYA
jgi:hypothetical protein